MEEKPVVPGVDVPKRKKPKRANAREQEFARLVLSGHTRKESYRIAYEKYDVAEQTLEREGSRIWKRAHVQLFYNNLVDEANKKAVMTRHEKRATLASIARDGSVKPTSRILAIKTDNDMTGDNAPIKTENTHLTISVLMNAIREGKSIEDMKQVEEVPMDEIDLDAEPERPVQVEAPLPNSDDDIDDFEKEEREEGERCLK